MEPQYGNALLKIDNTVRLNFETKPYWNYFIVLDKY